MCQKQKLQKMPNISRIALIAVAVVLLASCGQKKKAATSQSMPAATFPLVEVPEMMSEPSERLEYALEYFWDGFLSMTGKCDSSCVYGIPKEKVEEQFGAFSALLWLAPVNTAMNAVSVLFSKAETAELKDTSSNAFETLVSFAEKYLYDPNSPVRNEEFYLPFVQGLAKSEAIAPDMRPAYGYDATMCSLNRIGTKAADFAFKTYDGSVHTLYGVKSEYTLLFFVNPGCPNCKEITDLLRNSESVTEMEKSGQFTVVCIYIDEEIDKWKAFVHEYPSEWLCGYDHDYLIRTNQTYNIRAIPSLYLLGSDKKIILKDAPQDKVFEYIDRIYSSCQ